MNFADLLMMAGKYQDTPPFPLTPGLEIAGVVEALATPHPRLAPGIRVLTQVGSGGLASHITVPAERLTMIPDTVTDDEAAAFQITYGTAHLALVRRARMAAGETVAILGAAGGAGLAAVELASALGARVIAVARGEDRLVTCRDSGADITINSA
ncbi:MAG: NADPH:quinone oxidoreductase family protein, partial [Pseudomonadota bacterium]